MKGSGSVLKTCRTCIILGCALGLARASTAQIPNVVLSKEFVGDPVSAGHNVVLRFALSNTTGSQLSPITFTDDLSTALPGLAAIGLPQPACGGTVTGTTTLALGSARLDPHASCFFDVMLSVPSEAAGDYLNVTSAVTGGFLPPVYGEPASDTLFVDPIVFAKTFTSVDVAARFTTLAFTIRNPHPANTASAVSFQDDLDAMLAGASALGLPQPDVCGAGSFLDGTSLVTLNGGVLAADSDCTFAFTVQWPSGPVSPAALNVTSSVQVTVDGTTYNSSPAATYFPLIIADGFESADTSRWSVTVP